MKMENITFKGKQYVVKNGKLSLRNKEINDISEIIGLKDITQIKQLDLSNNKIKEIKNLESFGSLISLDLSNNEITEIKGLDTLQNMRFLKLSNNYIREIKGLDSLKNLMTLYLDKNLILEMKGLENLKKLNALFLGGNKIDEIKGINLLPNLKRFDLNSTKSNTKSQIKNLKKSGIHTKKQDTLGKRFGKFLLWYCIAIAIVDLIVSVSIMAGFTLPLIDIFPVFFTLYGILFIIGPIIYAFSGMYR